MKHLLTAIACCLAVAGSAQIHSAADGYNPDVNGDEIDRCGRPDGNSEPLWQ